MTSQPITLSIIYTFDSWTVTLFTYIIFGNDVNISDSNIVVLFHSSFYFF